jgi:hypothetical protein
MQIFAVLRGIMHRFGKQTAVSFFFDRCSLKIVLSVHSLFLKPSKSSFFFEN